MNKNDKFHGSTPPECENNSDELNDTALESVSGGMDALPNGGAPICPRCGGWMQNVCYTNGTPWDDSDNIRVSECQDCHYRM